MLKRCIAQRVEHWTFNSQDLGSNPNTPKTLMLNITINYVLKLYCIVFVRSKRVCLKLFNIILYWKKKVKVSKHYFLILKSIKDKKKEF